MRVIWTPEAQAHLDGIYQYVKRDAPFYVIDRGLVELVDRKPGKNVHVAQVDARTLLGDIAAFTGGLK